MKITKRMKDELDVLNWFALENVDYSKVKTLGKITDVKIIEDIRGVSGIEAYFEITTLGKKEVKTNNKAKLLQLLDAKKWALRMCEMYKEDLGTGIITMEEITEGMTDNVKDFTTNLLQENK